MVGKGAKSVQTSFILQAKQNHTHNVMRLGLTASRKIGNGVCRNRARRRLRALGKIILPKSGIQGFDYVLVARKQVLTSHFSKMQQEFKDRVRQDTSQETKMNEQNHHHFLIAIILCLLVLLGWQYFVIDPQLRAQREQQAQQENMEQTLGLEKESESPSQTLTPNINELGIPSSISSTTLTQKQQAPKAKTTTKRVRIETQQLQGSLALKGARLDDLVFAPIFDKPR